MKYYNQIERGIINQYIDYMSNVSYDGAEKCGFSKALNIMMGKEKTRELYLEACRIEEKNWKK